MKRAAALTTGVRLWRVPALLLIIVAILQTGGVAPADHAHSTWIETKWPFLMDQGGGG